MWRHDQLKLLLCFGGCLGALKTKRVLPSYAYRSELFLVYGPMPCYGECCGMVAALVLGEWSSPSRPLALCTAKAHALVSWLLPSVGIRLVESVLEPLTPQEFEVLMLKNPCACMRV